MLEYAFEFVEAVVGNDELALAASGVPQADAGGELFGQVGLEPLNVGIVDNSGFPAAASRPVQPSGSGDHVMKSRSNLFAVMLGGALVFVLGLPFAAALVFGRVELTD